ncbi:MAG: glucosidase, partial [Phycisphaeraceae bacterium]|nr:glucosidase [Phycisphaeraceae bacterium]
MSDASLFQAEFDRLAEDATRKRFWKRWGPYLAERQWGTVREDYSPDGNVWGYFTHDHARSRAYRWGEDGLLGFTDRQCRLCFAVALWNGKDPILKERFFGLNGHEGNHGEDVKEFYFYTDSSPTHSYCSAVYKYPQAEYPYQRLIDENRARSREEPEFNIEDSGVFDESRYFDVKIEYAKDSPNSMLIRVVATNRGPDPAPIWLIPQLWFRNTWAWGPTSDGDPLRPILRGEGS